jgi:hypothetical protein
MVKRLRGKTILLPLLIFALTVYPRWLNAQEIRVVESNGSVAVVNGGAYAGLKVGDTVRIMRLRNSSWKEISRARITEVKPKLARIEIVDGAPLVNFKTGDFVMKVRLAAQTRVNNMPIERIPDPNFSRFSPYRSRGVYLGPSSGVFVPFGNLTKYIGTSFGYGGLVGMKFRNNFDINVRFFYSYKDPDWYFWSMMVLGRKYLDNNLMMDLGYGIGYPIVEGRSGESIQKDGVLYFRNPLISLGIVAGMGYVLEISDSMWFEVGILGHYYPHFAGEQGTFFTIQGRLIM